MVKTNKEKKIIYEIIASTLNNKIEFFKPVPFSLQDSIQVIQNTRKILCQETKGDQVVAFCEELFSKK